MPVTWRDEAIIHMPPSYRFPRHYGALYLEILLGIIFCIISPVMLSACLFYFLTGWLVWRYTVLYVYERSYESGGSMFTITYHATITALYCLIGFTSLVLLFKQGFVQMVVLIMTIPFSIYGFDTWIRATFLEPMDDVHRASLVRMNAAPTLDRLDPQLYVRPCLRGGAVGWWPEGGKVWEKYGLAF